jgi:cytochrome c556
MRSFGKGLVAALILAAVTSGAAAAADNSQVIKDRQALMKEQAKDLGRVKAYLTGKGDQAGAEAGATDLTKTMQRIPSLFPPGSDAASPDGKYAPKPAIWSEPEKFSAARNTAAQKADALLAAVKGGNKDDIQTAFADLGKHGCGGCHESFRETLKK